jgi:hypothetical protein
MRVSRFRLAAFATATLVFGTTVAGPLVLEPQARLIPPVERYQSGETVAIDNNRAIVASSRLVGDSFDDFEVGAFLFERNASGQWLHTSTLVLDEHVFTPVVFFVSAAIQGDLAALAWENHLSIFERNGSAWVRTVVPTVSGDAGWDVAIEGGRILLAGTTGRVVVKNAAGQWVEEARLSAGSTTVPEEYGEDIDIGGNVAVLADTYRDSSEGLFPSVFVHERSGSSWSHTATLTAPFGDPFQFAYHTSTDGTHILASHGLRTGIQAFRKNGGVWTFDRTLRPVDALLGRSDTGSGVHGNAVSNGLALVSRATESPGSVLVYDLNDAESERPVAKLVDAPGAIPGNPNTRGSVGGRVDISGRQVIASARGGAVVYELPTSFTQPSIVQDDFQNGNAAQWTPVPGATFSVATAANGSLVYRQSSVAGDAISIRGNTDWTHQSIEADITPTAFNGSDRWFGLAVRYQDPGNYYYVTVRSTGVVQLKRNVNGQFVTLGTGNTAVHLNTPYRVRLEAIGTLLRVFVNDSVIAEAWDTALAHGQAGVMMYKAAADYDNVVITPNPRSALFRDTFASLDPAWESTSGTWVAGGQPSSLKQTDISGDARTFTGIEADDQSVRVTVRPTQFAEGSGDPWFGVAARYRDVGNYYYLTLRKSNQVSLRRVSNGQITVLDSAPFTVTVTAGKSYALKLEAVGNKIRGYVDGQLLVEATDSTLPTGRYGLVTYRAAAEYASLEVTQP